MNYLDAISKNKTNKQKTLPSPDYTVEVTNRFKGLE